MKTPESQSSYFQFISPFNSYVWLCILCTAVVVAVFLSLFEYYSSACRDDVPRLNGQESTWFVVSGLISGGTDSTPVTVAGRVLTAVWWFFALILISSYTANLAAFLTVRQISSPIETVSDLAAQTKIQYGTVKYSSEEEFFKNAKVEPFKSMYIAMTELFPGAMVDSTEEGLAKVAEGNYAFLWDSTVTSYIAATNCTFVEIGQPFDTKGYTIAVPPGASYLQELSDAMLQLSDDGTFQLLQHK
jgi:ABC-type amino acid transport substrate-binding protein